MPSTSSIEAVHGDIITQHIFKNLDGCSLASAMCTSSSLRLLAMNESLWEKACASEWPSSSDPRLKNLISSMNGGPRRFFSDASGFSPLSGRGNSITTGRSPPAPEFSSRRGRLVSGVDLWCEGRLVFSRVHETETGSVGFGCSPFRVDVVGVKEKVELGGGGEGGMRMSWVVVDSERKRATDLSSGRAVEVVGKHWLTGEVEVVFSWVLMKWVEARVVVRCRGGEVVGISLLVVDLEGRLLTGRETMAVFSKAMGGGGRRGRRHFEARVRFFQFVETRRRRRAFKLKVENLLDVACVAAVTLGVAVFLLFLLFRCGEFV